MDLCEVHQIESGTSVHDWLRQNVKSYDGSDRFTLLSGGEQISKHAPVSTDVDMVLRPGVFEATVTIGTWTAGTYLSAAAFLAVVSTIYSYYQYTQLPEGAGFKQGSPVYDANGQGNQIRLFDVIPEGFGEHAYFPDVISAPWREYIDNEQWLHLMLCVGTGKYAIDSGEIYIGNTPVSRYPSDILLTIFEPGADVTGHEAHRHIYTSKEVGQTSAGIGVELIGPGEQYAGIGDESVSWSFLVDEITWQINNQTSVGLEVGDIFQLNTETGFNDGLYRVDDKSGTTVTVTRMLDASTPDPDWLDSDASDNSFITENDITAEVIVIGEGGYSGPYLATPRNEVTNKFWVDFRFPNGLYKVSSSTGDLLDQNVEFDIEYRDADLGGAWTVLNYSLNVKKTSEIAFSKEIDLGSDFIKPEVRIRRTTAKKNGSGVVNDFFLVGLRSELDAQGSYAGVTTIAVSVKGTNAIAGAAENQFNIVATRKIPEYQGSDDWVADQATRDISAAMRYIIHDIGLDDDNIDMEELLRLHDIWTARGDTFDGIFDSAGTFFETLKSVLSPGYSVPILTGNSISMVRDEARSTFLAMYQPDNIIGGIQRGYQLFDEDEPDGIEVEYFSSVTWKPETIQALLPGDTGASPERIKAFGITDETRAWRLGMRKRRERRYRRKEYRFKTELDALNSQFGDYVALGDDFPEYSQTGRVLAVDDRQITVDRDLAFTSDTQYIAIRKPDGKLSGPYEAFATSEPNVIEIDDDLDFVPVLDGSQEPPFYQFGTAQRWTEAALVADVKPSGMDSVDVICTNYDERVYADDNNSPP